MNVIIVIEVPNKHGRKALYLGNNLILEHHPNDGDFASDKLYSAARALSLSLGQPVFTKQFDPSMVERAYWEDVFPVIQSQVESEIECLRDTFTIQFDLNGTVTQEIELINSEYSYEGVLNGLKDGSLSTTTWYDNDVGKPAYVSTQDDKLVARIISQEIDGSYEDFELPN